MLSSSVVTTGSRHLLSRTALLARQQISRRCLASVVARRSLGRAPKVLSMPRSFFASSTTPQPAPAVAAATVSTRQQPPPHQQQQQQQQQQHQQDFVRAAISKLLEEHHHHAAPKSDRHISDEALRKAAGYFENQLEEARLCVRDCRETVVDAEREVEYAGAEAALEEAVASFVDFFEALRQSTVEQQESWRSLRERASLLKELRSELSALKPTPKE